MRKERRDSIRFEIEEDLVRIERPGRLTPVRVVDLSAGGSGLIVPAELAGTVGRDVLKLVLPGCSPIEALAVPVRSTKLGGEEHLGMRFERLDPDTLGSLSSFLVERCLEQARSRSFVLADQEPSLGVSRRDQVYRLLSFYGLSRGRTLWAYRGQVQLPVTLKIKDFDTLAARQLIVAEPLGGGDIEEGQEYTFAFAGFNAINYFEAIVWRTTAERVWITIPGGMRQAGFRGSFRIGLAGQHLELRIAHPRIAGFRLVKPVLDVGARGLSFPLNSAIDCLFPGEELPEVRLDIPGGPVRAEAVIRTVQRRPDAAGLACGIEFTRFVSDRQAERWGRFVFRMGHPNLELGDAQAVAEKWRVLESSGYVDETTESLRTHLARRFFFSWKKHSDNPRLGRYMFVQKDGRAVGIVAASLIYPRTWLVHHLGIDEKERKADKRRVFELAREAYCGMQHLLNNMADIDFFLIYADAKLSWNEMIYGHFMQRYPDKKSCTYEAYKVYKCRPGLSSSTQIQRNESVEIVPGDDRLLESFSRHLEYSLAVVEFESFCYRKEEIDLEEFSRECAEVGYERERRVFFAIEKDTPRAALIAETGDEGTNIFGLLNKCWFVHLEPEAVHDGRLKSLLLHRALQYYRSKGKQEFIFLGSWIGEPEDVLKPLGFYFVADGLRFLARRSVLPAWMSYLDELMRMMHG